MALLATAGAGCFDVATVSPGILVDDFEDRDDLPSGPTGFGPWVVFSYGPDGQPVAQTIEERGTGQHGLDVQFTLADPPDGQRQYGGGGLGIFAVDPGLSADLSTYTEMRISASLERGDSPPPDVAQVAIRLNCSGVPDPTSGAPVDAAIQQLLPGAIKSGWTALRLPMAAFQQSTAPGVAAIHSRDCLTRVDGIVFTVNPSFEDGQAATLTLHLDDIQFVDAHN